LGELAQGTLHRKLCAPASADNKAVRDGPGLGRNSAVCSRSHCTRSQCRRPRPNVPATLALASAKEIISDVVGHGLLLDGRKASDGIDEDI